MTAETSSSETEELDRFRAEVELVHEVDLDVHEEIATAQVDGRELAICLAYSGEGSVYVKIDADEAHAWERVRIPLSEIVRVAHEHTSERGDGGSCPRIGGDLSSNQGGGSE